MDKMWKFYSADENRVLLDGRLITYLDIAGEKNSHIVGVHSMLEKFNPADYPSLFASDLSRLKEVALQREYSGIIGHSFTSNCPFEELSDIPGDLFKLKFPVFNQHVKNYLNMILKEYTADYFSQKRNDSSLRRLKEICEIDSPRISLLRGIPPVPNDISMYEIPGFRDLAYEFPSTIDIEKRKKLRQRAIKPRDLSVESVLNFLAERKFNYNEGQVGEFDIQREFCSIDEGNSSEVNAVVRDLVAIGVLKQAMNVRETGLTSVFKIEDLSVAKETLDKLYSNGKLKI